MKTSTVVLEVGGLNWASERTVVEAVLKRRPGVTGVTARIGGIWDVRVTKTARCVMNDSIFFATFDPLYINAPDACNLCIAQPPAFNYEYCVEQSDGQRHYIKGFCCTACAAGLLLSLIHI